MNSTGVVLPALSPAAARGSLLQLARRASARAPVTGGDTAALCREQAGAWILQQQSEQATHDPAAIRVGEKRGKDHKKFELRNLD